MLVCLCGSWQHATTQGTQGLVWLADNCPGQVSTNQTSPFLFLDLGWRHRPKWTPGPYSIGSGDGRCQSQHPGAGEAGRSYRRHQNRGAGWRMRIFPRRVRHGREAGGEMWGYEMKKLFRGELWWRRSTARSRVTKAKFRGLLTRHSPLPAPSYVWHPNSVSIRTALLNAAGLWNVD